MAQLLIGNLFCMACPFVLVGDLARRLLRPRWTWPRRLRNKWLGVALTVLLLFSYELFDLWAEPLWTVVLILIYFAGALVLGVMF